MHTLAAPHAKNLSATAYAEVAVLTYSGADQGC